MNSRAFQAGRAYERRKTIDKDALHLHPLFKKELNGRKIVKILKSRVKNEICFTSATIYGYTTIIKRALEQLDLGYKLSEGVLFYKFDIT